MKAICIVCRKHYLVFIVFVLISNLLFGCQEQTDVDQVKASCRNFATLSTEFSEEGKVNQYEKMDLKEVETFASSLLTSCKSREKRRVTPQLWDEWSQIGSGYHIRYNSPQVFSINIDSEVSVTEMLIFVSPESLKGKILVRYYDTYYSPFQDCDINIILKK